MTKEEQFLKEVSQLSGHIKELFGDSVSDIPLNSEYKELKSKYRKEIEAAKEQAND